MWWLLASVALGAEPVDPFEEADESALYRLDQQLVTVASRYAQTVRTAPSIVTLITADDIRDRGYRTLSDLLRDLPGIYVWKSKEGRDLASFRGVVSSDNNKILLLIDGVPWYDGVYTHAFIGNSVPMHNIRQVEVIKGPGSAIYGTNAFAGVINVVTFDGADLQGGRVRFEAGATGRTEVTAVGGTAQQIGQVSADVAVYARVLQQLGDGLGITPKGRYDLRGYDPKRSINVGARANINGLRLQISHTDYQHSFLESEADSLYGALAKNLDSFGLYYHDTAFDARYDAKLSRDVVLTPNVWLQRHDNPGSYFFLTGLNTEQQPDGSLQTTQGMVTVGTEKDTRRWGTGLDLKAQPGIDHVIVSGLGIESVDVLGLRDLQFIDGNHEPEAPTFKATTGASLRNLFGYAQYTWTLIPELEITGGARVDKRIPSNPGERNDQGAFALFPSPRAGILLVPSSNVTAKILYGRAFRSPSVRELLVRDNPDADGNYQFASGNLALLPESTHTVDGEITADLAEPIQVRIGGYWSVFDNEIEKVTPPNQYQNLQGLLQSAGAEAELMVEAKAAQVSASYTYTQARYAGGPLSGRTQYEFPPHMIKGRVRIRPTDTASFGLLAEAYGQRPRRDWSPTVGAEDGPVFGLVHLFARVAGLGHDKRLQIGTTLRNATNARWSTGVYRDDIDAGTASDPKYPESFEGEGRSLLVSLEYAL